jgi:excisionase family DNA binding protein
MNKLITTAELSHHLNVPISRIYNLVFRQMIPYVKIGGSLRFKSEQIELWLRTQEKNLNLLAREVRKKNEN